MNSSATTHTHFTWPRYSLLADCPFLNNFSVGYLLIWNIDWHNTPIHSTHNDGHHDVGHLRDVSQLILPSTTWPCNGYHNNTTPIITSLTGYSLCKVSAVLSNIGLRAWLYRHLTQNRLWNWWMVRLVIVTISPQLITKFEYESLYPHY